MKLLSVVTVTYNAEKTLERTLLSTFAQSAIGQIEVIIIDGQSKDSTLDIVRRYESQIDIVVSEPDHGIYDAMNHGTRIATAPWICFMNAGDTFFDSQTVASLHLENRNADHIIFGDCMLEKQGQQTYRQAQPFYNTPHRLCSVGFCHQSTYCPTEWMRQHPFNWQKFPYCADYEAVRFFWQEGRPFTYLPQPLCTYGWGEGFSSVKQHHLAVLRENAIICRKLYSFEYFKQYWHIRCHPIQ